MSELNHISEFERAIGDAIAEFSPAERDALADAWRMVGDAAPVSADVRAEARRRVAQRTWADTEQRPALRLIPGWLLRPLAVAASVLMLVVAGVLTRPDQMIYRAPSGSAAIASFELPDGTVVELSPGSELRLDESFAVDDRNVELLGEVFFDVEPGALPFRIHTENALVEVLGTAFNVRSWQDDDFEDTQVFVTRGSVKVAPGSMGMDVRLGPGDAARVRGDGLPELPSAVNADRALAWRSGGLAFNDEPVSAILAEVSRRFDVRIRVPESARDQRMSFYKHRVEDVEETMSDVTDAAGLRFRRTANGFDVFVP